ncbi:MAG: nitroreductase family protein, partial [Rikenellaceae bacterium]
MKNSWQIVTLLMAVALVAMAIKLTTQNPSDAPCAVDSEEVIYNAIMTRSSVRNYTSQGIEMEKIEKLLKAAMAAPTAGNKQPWEFLVVTNRAILDTFPTIIPGAHMSAKAQLAIVVLGSPAKSLLPDYWVQDCSAATENILLAAHGMGLGAVWCGAYPNNEANRVGQISELLSLPEGTYALSIIVIGHPAGEPTVKDKWDPSK